VAAATFGGRHRQRRQDRLEHLEPRIVCGQPLDRSARLGGVAELHAALGAISISVPSKSRTSASASGSSSGTGASSGSMPLPYPKHRLPRTDPARAD
jgi:hypothetical protein